MYGLINQPAVFMTEDDLKSRSDELFTAGLSRQPGKRKTFGT